MGIDQLLSMLTVSFSPLAGWFWVASLGRLEAKNT
jgi:hypothetical protein